MDISKIKYDGFVMNEVASNIDNIAFISLKLSLKAYFNTYSCFLYKSEVFDNEGISDEKKSIEYIENCCEAVTHFHHFVELFLKDILKMEHMLLAIDASEKPEILYDLLKRNSISKEHYENLKFLEFSTSLERLKKLIDIGKFDSKYMFISAASEWLKTLNLLRNRISHRGSFILSYEALDNLFGRYILPFVKEIFDLPEFNKTQARWKHEKLDCNIDVIDEIIKSFRTSYKKKKVALLKELGRAAYANPIVNWPVFGMQFSQSEIDFSIRIADIVSRNDSVQDTKKCPVCGIKTLLLFYDIVDDEDEHGNILKSTTYVYKAKCYCCTLEFTPNIGKIDKFKLPLDNYWKV